MESMIQAINDKWWKTSHLLIKDVGLRKVKAKTRIFQVFNNNHLLLGSIQWQGQWRQYSFFPLNSTVFNEDCLFELSEICVMLTALHMEKLPYKLRERKMKKAMRERRKKLIAERKALTNKLNHDSVENDEGFKHD